MKPTITPRYVLAHAGLAALAAIVTQLGIWLATWSVAGAVTDWRTWAISGAVGCVLAGIKGAYPWLREFADAAPPTGPLAAVVGLIGMVALLAALAAPGGAHAAQAGTDQAAADFVAAFAGLVLPDGCAAASVDMHPVIFEVDTSPGARPLLGFVWCVTPDSVLHGYEIRG